MGNTKSNVIEGTLDNGKVLPFRPFTKGKDNTAAYGVIGRKVDGTLLSAPAPTGTKVSAAVIGDELPASFTIAGETFNFEPTTVKVGDDDLTAVTLPAGSKVTVDDIEQNLRLVISTSGTTYTIHKAEISTSGARGRKANVLDSL